MHCYFLLINIKVKCLKNELKTFVELNEF